MRESPLHQFTLKPLIVWEWNGYTLNFSNSSLMMILSVIVPVAWLLYATRSPLLVPGRMQSAAELLYRFVASMVYDTNGKEGITYVPFIFSLFIFLAFGNLLGLLPYSFTFTSHISVTFGLAFFVLLFLTGVGVVRQGWCFLERFFPPGTPWLMAPLLIPVEIISYLSRPVSLSVRLFANIVAGHTMLEIVGGFVVALAGFLSVAPFIISIALILLEVCVALLQAYVFTILTCLYLHDALYKH